jgi:hypothetical protein
VLLIGGAVAAAAGVVLWIVDPRGAPLLEASGVHGGGVIGTVF